MPTKRKEQLSNPLFRLRLMLGVGQVEFAYRCGIAVATVRSIEGGRRALTEQSLERIRRSLGATLNRATGQWYLPPPKPVAIEELIAVNEWL